MLSIFTKKYRTKKVFSSITLALISICISFYLAIHYPHDVVGYDMSLWFTIIFDIVIIFLFFLFLVILGNRNFQSGIKKSIIPFVIITVINSYFILFVSYATNVQLFNLNFKSEKRGVLFTHSLKTNVVCGKPLNRDIEILYLPGSELIMNGETRVRVLCPINNTLSSLLYKTSYVTLFFKKT